MTLYRIGVKATAVHYYEIEADTLDEALDTWPDGVLVREAGEVVDEDGPVFAEAQSADGTWSALDLPADAVQKS